MHPQNIDQEIKALKWGPWIPFMCKSDLAFPDDWTVGRLYKARKSERYKFFGGWWEVETNGIEKDIMHPLSFFELSGIK